MKYLDTLAHSDSGVGARGNTQHIRGTRSETGIVELVASVGCCVVKAARKARMIDILTMGGLAVIMARRRYCDWNGTNGV